MGATVAALTGGLLMTSAPTASAAGVCGSSYRLIDTYRMTGDGGTRGYLYLYYSPSGYNCAVAKPVSSWAGDVRYLQAHIMRGDGTRKDRDGQGANYSYYAGPVYVYAPNSCISLGGWFWGPDDNFYADSGDTTKVHCG